MHSARIGIFRIIIVLLCTGLISACAGMPATPAAPSLEPVSLQLQWVTQAQFAGYYVALDKGWYAEEGIDLTIVPGGPDIIPVDLVSSGRHDFGTSLLADLVTSIYSGKPVISIAQIQQRNGLLLVTRKSSGITGPADFVGHRIGVWLGGWEAQFNALIAREGIKPDQFELVSQGWSMDPFINGELDVASAMIYNEYLVLLERGIPESDLTIIDYADYGLDFPGDTLFTTRDMVEQNPDLCLRMLRASLRGWQYAVEHPEEAADIVLRYDESGVQTREHQLAMMKEIARLVALPLRPIGYTNRDDVIRTIDTLLTYGVLGGPVSPEDVYTNEFWQQIQAK